MTIRTLKSALEAQLIDFYLEIKFTTSDKKNIYSLPLIAKLVNLDEAIDLQNNLIESIQNKGFKILSVYKPIRLYSQEQIDRRKQTIETTQKMQGSKPIKIILKSKEIEGKTKKLSHTTEDIKQFNINTVKTGGVPFDDIKDLFVFEIDKSILEDNEIK
ncbi:hypothetical protein [Flavobacterium beibuense]|uniref:hypothetical protein n=1 Tax=Flavobacterium beibuense TaxID=657326 RepID=UPI003A9588BF